MQGVDELLLENLGRERLMGATWVECSKLQSVLACSPHGGSPSPQKSEQHLRVHSLPDLGQPCSSLMGLAGCAADGRTSRKR